MCKFIEIKINSEYITLGQFVKIADLVNSGGESKYFLLNNNVIINGIKDNRRGRKLYRNDLVEINGETYKIC